VTALKSCAEPSTVVSKRRRANLFENDRKLLWNGMAIGRIRVAKSKAGANIMKKLVNEDRTHLRRSNEETRAERLP
jgi:hypothetical protein